MNKKFTLLSLSLAAASCASPKDYSAYHEGTGRYRLSQNALVGQNAPPLPGAEITWSSFGKRHVIVSFLATWNSTSAACARRAEALAAAHPETIACIHVLSSVDARQAAAYAAKHGLKSALLADADGSFRQALGNDLFPDVYIIKNGQIEGADLKEEEIASALGF
ncbi:MAG: hypothetical protein RL095_4003 [Verrucomicrobiota bacterium]|jgi:hypothetical protein